MSDSVTNKFQMNIELYDNLDQDLEGVFKQVHHIATVNKCRVNFTFDRCSFNLTECTSFESFSRDYVNALRRARDRARDKVPS